MKRIAIIVLAILFATPSIALADDASKQAKIREFFAIMHIDQTMKQMVDLTLQQVQGMSKQMLNGATLTAAEQKQLDDFQKKALDLVSSEMGWATLEPDFVKLYAETYSEEEVDGILAFYKSPIGQSMLAKTPDITAKSIVISQDHMKVVQPKLIQLLDDFKKQVAAAAAAKSK